MRAPLTFSGLLLLVACGGVHRDLDIDTDEGGDLADLTQDLPDGGEGLTVNPVDGSLLTDDGPAVAEGDLSPRFRWESATGELSLPSKIAGASITTDRAGDWRSRVATGGRYGAATGGSRAMRRGGGGMPSRAVESAPMLEAMGYADSSVDMSSSAREMAAVGGLSGRGPGQAPAGMRAGSTDDNEDLAGFEGFVAEWSALPGMADKIDTLDVSDARTITVLDPVGRPVPGAQVSIIDRATSALVWTGTTFGDGTAPFYPHLRHGLLGENDVHGGAGWEVQARQDGVWTQQAWDGEDEGLELTLDVSSDGPVKLDVVFLIDTTGSMSDEIDRVKHTLLRTTDRLRGLDEEMDLQYGAVLYRDIGDEYVTRAHPLTGDIVGFDGALQGITAGGGGDGPESLNQGMAVAVGQMDWREGAAKLVFLVADAPPHMDYQQDVSYGRSSLAALHSGIRVHTVAASGLDDHGSVVFRQAAQLTQGQFIFIEYGSTAASAADHGVTGSVSSNNLDDIIFREIKGELEGWGQPNALARR
jgi:hypothetical protein